MVHPLVRLKNTLSQTAVGSRRDRADNVRHAFGLIDPRRVRGQRVTLVDDVMTTAATLKIRRHGAEGGRATEHQCAGAGGV